MGIKSKRTLTITIVTLAGLGFSLAFILRSTIKKPTPASAPPAAQSIPAPPKQAQVKPGVPVRLKIPVIHVDAAIERVGLAPDGAMDISKNLDNVAWFEQGPHPGENGSAVIAGHYGWANGKAAVFNDLHALQKGDRINVDDQAGATTVFVVRKNQSYDPQADASEIFSSRDGKSHLNLVTCEGSWDELQKSYSDRLIVFADKE